MEKQSIVLKIAVLAMSVSLAGCFIAYRSGAFEEKNARSNETIMSGSKSAKIPATITPAPVDSPRKATPEDQSIMRSSKSGGIFEEEPARDSQPEPNLELIPSSKSAPIFRPKPDTGVPKNNNPEAAPANNEPIMNSSKSGDIFRPAPQRNQQAPNPNEPPK